MAGAAFFTASHCDACHSGPRWSISRSFYTPGTPATGTAPMGRTINDGNPLPVGENALINTALTIPGTFPNVFRPAAFPAGSALNLRLANSTGSFDAANDQITCVLRNVGTYPPSGTTGISVAPNTVLEVRQDMTTPAQGAGGFNPPSLLGAVVGAPYFHAGNARTLEEVFTSTFNTHAATLNTNFFTAGTAAMDIQHLIAFLITVDASTTVIAVPTTVTSGGTSFNPILCPTSFP
jgi:cytochrome c peroxidase